MDEKKDGDLPDASNSESPSHDDDVVAQLVPAPASHPLAPPALLPQSWGVPLAKLDKVWTRLEARLCAWVLVGEIVALCIWVFLKGMAAGYSGGEDISGLALRALVGAVLLGLVAHKVLKPKNEADVAAQRKYSIGTTAAVCAGLVLCFSWANWGAEYCSNMLNWLQSASVLTLIGGLRGVATRLTLWLALLGASLATAQGKHINVDVVMRFLTPKMRVPVAVLGWLAAALMCFAGVWGFFDNIAIVDFHAPVVRPCEGEPDKSCEVPPGERIAHVGREIARLRSTSRAFRRCSEERITMNISARPSGTSG